MSFLGSLFGGRKKTQTFTPASFSGGGISTSSAGNTIRVTPGAERRGLVGDIAATFKNKASEIAALRSQVTPGFGRLTQARLAEIEGGRRRAVGNLAQNLQNRRIFGSSFAQATLAQAEREFADERQRVAAESFLQELELNNQLLDQESAAQAGAFQVALEELNLEAEIGTQLASQATAQLGANARLTAQLDAQNAAGTGSFIGTLLGIGARFIPGFT